MKYPIECYFVISLGEKYEDGNRYKLLASVIDKESIYLSEHSYNKGQPFYYMREDTNQLQCCILKYYDEITDCLVAKNPDYPNVDLVFSKDLVGNVVFLTSKEALNRSAMSNEASLQVEDSKTRELNEESSTLNKDFDDHIEEIDDNKNSKRQRL